MNHEGAVEKDRYDGIPGSRVPEAYKVASGDPSVGLGSLGEEVESAQRRQVRTYGQLFEHAGSMLTLMTNYWKHHYHSSEEKVIEDAISPDERFKYKPCQ